MTRTDLSTLLTATWPDDRPALALAHESRSRAWARDSILSLGGRLAAARIRRCLLALEDAGRMAIGFAAAARAGCEILLPASLAPGHLAELAADADMVLSDQPALPGLDILAAAGHAQIPAAPLDLTGIVVTIHTSGSTGVPVAVPRPLATLAAEIATLEATFSPAGKAVLGSVPPYHIYGLLFRVLWPLTTNRTIVAGLLHYPNDLVRAAEDYPGAVFVSSPAFLKRAVQVFDPAILSRHLSIAFSSGGALDPAVGARWNGTAAAPLIEVYGSTETGGIAYRRGVDETAAPLWTPFAGVRVGRDADTGRLRLRSPHQAGAGDVLCCDLIGALSPGGAFALLGRSDRIVKIEETRVGLDEVEAAISALAEVAAVRVFPLIRGRRTALAGVVIPSELGWAALSERGRRAMVATLTARLRRTLPEAALPRRWRFARALPQNAHGKITTAALEALFANAMDRVMEPERLGAMTEGDGPVVMLRVQPELCYFDGHFDGAPILPGVVLIDWAVRMARSRFGIEQPFLRLEAVKFFRVASAGIELQLALSRKPGSDKIGFQFTSAAGQHSSGRILFGREQEDAA